MGLLKRQRKIRMFGYPPRKQKREKIVVSISPAAMCALMLVFVFAGTFAIAVVERKWMRIESYSSITALLAAMSDTSDLFGTATTAVILLAIYNLAFPLAVCVLVDEIRRHENNLKLVLGIALCALVSEPFYDYAVYGKYFDLSSQNPAVSLLICAIVLCILKGYAKKQGRHTALLVILLSVASVVWFMFLSCELGVYMLLLTVIFWFLWFKTVWMNALAFVSTIYAFPAPLSLVFVYFFNGAKKPMTTMVRWIIFAAYPLQFIICSMIADFT